VDKGGTPLVGALAGVVDERRQACGQMREYVGSLISGAMPHMPGWAACRSGAVVCGFGTVTGHPVTHQPRHHTVIPRMGMSHGLDTCRISNL